MTTLTTGETADLETRQALAYREADQRLRRLYKRLSERRQHWANSTLEGSVARAVAYQSVMGDLSVLITDIERIAAG